MYLYLYPKLLVNPLFLSLCLPFSLYLFLFSFFLYHSFSSSFYSTLRFVSFERKRRRNEGREERKMDHFWKLGKHITCCTEGGNVWTAKYERNEIKQKKFLPLSFPFILFLSLSLLRQKLCPFAHLNLPLIKK